MPRLDFLASAQCPTGGRCACGGTSFVFQRPAAFDDITVTCQACQKTSILFSITALYLYPALSPADVGRRIREALGAPPDPEPRPFEEDDAAFFIRQQREQK